MPHPRVAQSILRFGARLIRPNFRRSPIDLMTGVAPRTAAEEGVGSTSASGSLPRRKMRDGVEQIDSGFFTRNEEYNASMNPPPVPSGSWRHHDAARPAIWMPQTHSRSRNQERTASYNSPSYSDGVTAQSGTVPSADSNTKRQDYAREWEAYHHEGSAQRRSWRREYGFFDSHELAERPASRGYQVPHRSAPHPWTSQSRNGPPQPPNRQAQADQSRGHRPQPSSRAPQGHESQGERHARFGPMTSSYEKSQPGRNQLSSRSPREEPALNPHTPALRSSSEDTTAHPPHCTSSRNPWSNRDSLSRTPGDIERKVPVRSKPRASYFSLTKVVPSIFPCTAGPPPALPLLILDLNGTLVWRGPKNANAQNPTRRPYLSSFLQYCLDVQDISFQRAEERSMDLSTSDVDQAAASCRREDWMSAADYLRGIRSGDPRGVHFQMGDSEDSGQTLPTSATQRLLVWSSAQPQNVDAMVRSILHPAQARHLIRVWARDTLVPRRLYSQKSPSIKDLEVVWNALNHDMAFQSAIGGWKTFEGERRVDATYREAADSAQPDVSPCDSGGEEGQGSSHGRQKSYSKGVSISQRRRQPQGASLLAALASGRFVSAPKLSASGEWKTAGRGFGVHNTLLLDDSTDKAVMQPFNHILVPAFDEKRASASKLYRAQLTAKRRRRQKAQRRAEQAQMTAAYDVPSSSPGPLGYDEPTSGSNSGQLRQQAHVLNALGAPASEGGGDVIAEGMQSSSDVVQDPASPTSPHSSSASFSDCQQMDVDELVSQPDTVLLQVVGVLEHARWQVNVASWIRNGGLGSFAGMKQPGASAEDDNRSAKISPSQRRKAQNHHRKLHEQNAGKDEELPRLDAKPAEKTEEFWLVEGRNALRRRGVRMIF